ncbi:hypothetical protein [Pontibacillus yanchengensis]|uniref:Uncharacterized protein n=1 Tax=Pontibacillus yanchengensis Y32 TaxID=1385514 RepID=A0A0A2TFK0_9BACI|nr:hypothetical protein [Pontibacillus yanchengensis]KGP72846.1 hypothetical protein N782_10275 [Pontibacillus yanchengensis Y32]
MNKMVLGLLFVIIGIVFLMILLTQSLPIFGWIILLVVSVIANISGTTILIRYIQNNQQNT